MLAASVGVASAGTRPVIPPGLPSPNGGPALRTQPEAGTTLKQAGIAPVSSVLDRGGIQTNALTAWPYQYACITPWMYVTALPAGYVTGACPYAGTINAQVASEAFDTPWLGGDVRGNYNGCGWINAHFVVASGQPSPTGACADPSRAVDKYVYHTGATPWIWSDPSNPYDGLSVDNATACQTYQNYRPWSDANRPVDPWVVIPAHAKNPAGDNRLRIRYLTKFASADGSGYYVMAHDTQSTAGLGNWLFVPLSCI